MAASIIPLGRPVALAFIVLALALPSAAAAQRDDGWIGIVLQDVTGSMATALGLERAEGVLVSSVQDGGPAAEAGVQAGDVIVRFNRRAVEDSNDLARLVRRTEPGRKARLEVVRGGERRTLELRVAARPEPEQDITILQRRGRAERQEAPRDRLRMLEQFQQRSGGWLGVQMQDLSAQLGEYFGVGAGEGALIQEVVEGGPADEAGLRAGDVIVRMGGETIASAAEVTRRMARTQPGERLEVQVIRDRSPRTFEVVLGERQGLSGVPRAFWLPSPDAPDAPDVPRLSRPFHFGREFRSDDPDLRRDLQELRSQLRELQRELRELQREFRSQGVRPRR